MRIIAFVLAASIVGIQACDDSSSDPAASVTATPQPSAREVLQRSDLAMNRLRSVRVRVETRPTVAPDVNRPTIRVEEYAAPDRAHYITRSERGELEYEVVSIGSTRWERTGLRGWQSGPYLADGPWPAYQRAAGSPLGSPAVVSGSMQLGALRQQMIDGVDAWAVTYSFEMQTHEGPVQFSGSEWIAKDSLLLLRREHENDDPFGAQERVVETYYDFDAAISIEPPA